MANEVYANGMEIACKAAAGKSVAAFPDTCLTPPPPPAGPIPVPYPNTAYASDTTKGTTTVMISGQEVMMKDQSTFKKSTGDEAATRAQGMGVVTHIIQGEASFVAWSMDVKFEGANVDRHLDQMMHNEQCSPANTVPWIYQDATAFGNPTECEEDTRRMQQDCRGSTSTLVISNSPYEPNRWHHTNCSPQCKEAMSCILVPKGMDKEMCCAPDNTGHHMIENHWIQTGGNLNPNFARVAGMPEGAYHGAPCVCVNPERSTGNHQQMHNVQGVYEESYMPGGARFDADQPNGGWTYGAAKKASLNAHDATFGSEQGEGRRCSEGCLEAQLDHFYGDDPNRPMEPPGSARGGQRIRQPLGAGRTEALSNWVSTISGNH